MEKTDNITFFEGLEIETPHGFVPFEGVMRLPEKVEIFEVELYSGDTLKCSANHKLFSNNEEISLGDITVGLTEIDIKGGCSLVKNIKSTNEFEHVYDVIGVQNKDKSYYTSDIVSHNCSFFGSSVTLIDGEFIINHMKAITPIEQPDEWTKYWALPELGRRYAISVDISQGVGSDYSVANVFDVTEAPERITQVCCYRRNDINVPDFTKIVYQMARYFNMAYLIIETNNGLGDEMQRTIFDEPYEYENCFFDHDRQKYGIYATRGNKPTSCNYLKEFVESKKLILNDETLIEEIGYFEELRENVFKAKNSKGCHDDTVMTCVWLAYFLKSRYFEDEKDSWALEANPPPESQDENAYDVWNDFLNKDYMEVEENWLDREVNTDLPKSSGVEYPKDGANYTQQTGQDPRGGPVWW